MAEPRGGSGGATTGPERVRIWDALNNKVRPHRVRGRRAGLGGRRWEPGTSEPADFVLLPLVQVIAGNATPLLSNLNKYLAKYPHRAVYTGQDGKDVSEVKRSKKRCAKSRGNTLRLASRL